MKFNEAKNILEKGYLDLGLEQDDQHQLNLELGDENQKELFFKHPRSNTTIRISRQEIEGFAAFNKIRAGFETQPVECGMCSVNYREQMVDFSTYGIRRFYSMRDRVFTFGNPSTSEYYAEIGYASDKFVNYFRFDKTPAQSTIEKMKFRHNRESEDNGHEMHNILFRPITIRVHNINVQNIKTALKHTDPIIDTCLFELSYLKNLTLTLQDEWPRRRARVRPFQFGDRFSENTLPLQKAKFNPDIIRFYQRGMSTNDPFIQFLSFYHVLEYYFIEISDEQLYSKLSRRLNDPRFATTSNYLDRLIQDTLTHKQETDETKMLKDVLERFVDQTELFEFIKAYEEYQDVSLYTKQQTLFGDKNKVELRTGHIYGNLAKRIKIIRNALVHSSDRYERKQRYIPTTKSELIISKEIPMMKFLAEKVIIGSAK